MHVMCCVGILKDEVLALYAHFTPGDLVSYVSWLNLFGEVFSDALFPHLVMHRIETLLYYLLKLQSVEVDMYGW